MILKSHVRASLRKGLIKYALVHTPWCSTISACLIHYVMLKLQLLPSIVVVVDDAYKKYTFWQNIWEKISWSPGILLWAFKRKSDGCRFEAVLVHHGCFLLSATFQAYCLNSTSLAGCRIWYPTDLQHLCCKALINK